MPTDDILTLLITERDRLDAAIEALQGPTKRRDRPPENPAPLSPVLTAGANGHRRGMTAAARKAQSKRMKAYWAKRRRASK